MHCSWVLQIPLFSHFFIKNWSHGTIHTFKNYFATVFSVSAKISSIQTDSKYRIPRSKAMLSPSLKVHSSARQLLVLPDPLVKPLTQFPSLLQSRPPSPTLPEFPRANPSMFRVNQPLGGFFPANLYEIFHRGMFVEAIQSIDFSCLTNTRPKEEKKKTFSIFYIITPQVIWIFCAKY